MMVIFFTLLCIALCGAIYDSRKCGVINSDTLRIINGIPSEVAYPWFAALVEADIFRYKREVSVTCGGSLITSRHVLTAAHCYKRIPEVIRPAYYNVALGMKNRCDGDRLEVSVRNVFVNGLFNENWKPIPERDIAFVELSYDVPNTPICLPSRLSYNWFKAIAIGFGTTDRKHPTYPCQLLYAPMIINTREHCLKTNYKPEYMARRTICAYNVNYTIDPCFADSGGPLMVDVQGRYELIGVLSYGKVCAGKNWPKIYTDVTDLGYGGWIKERIYGSLGKRSQEF